jgi:hypothetical protein
MADVTEKQFSELIAEQKASKEIAGDAMQKQMDGIGNLKSAQNETTRTLARSLMSAEERAAADAEASRKNANRVAGGIQAADTRKANADAAAETRKVNADDATLDAGKDQSEESSNLLEKIGKGFTNFLSFSKGSASADKETENEAAANDAKERGLLGKIAGGITGLTKSFADGAKEKMKKGFGGFMSMLKKFAIGGLMTALLLFMNSKYWEDTKKFISKKIMPALEDFYKKTLKPFALGIGKFFKDPTWENFKNIFDVKNPLGLVVGLAGIATLLAPGLMFKGLMLGVKTFTKAAALAGTGLMKLGSDVRTDKDGKTRDKKTGKFAKKDTGKLKGMKNLGKGLLRGAKFLPFVGLGITALMGVFDGVTAGLEEAKNENSTKATILRESIAGIGSGLTFGLIDQETISKGLTSISTSAASGFNAAKKAFTDFVSPDAQWSKDLTAKSTAAVESLKLSATAAVDCVKAGFTMLTTDPKGAFNLVSSKLSELTGLTLPNFDETKAALTNLGTNLASKFEGLTNITIPNFDEVNKGLTNLDLNLASKFEGLTNITIPSFDEVKKGLTNLGTNLASKFEGITGIEIPSFDEVKKGLTNLGTNLASKFEGLTGIEIPSFDEVKKGLTNLGTNLASKFEGLTGIDLGDKFDVVGEKIAVAIKGISDFFKDLFDFDIKAVLKSVPGGETLLKLLGGEDSTAKRELADLKLIDYDTFNKDDLNFDNIEKLLADQRKDGGTVNPTILAALNKITEDDSVDEDDREKLKKMLARGKATGGPISSGKGYLVGELGPELIIPNQSAQVVNADRTKTMAEAALQRGAANQNSGSGTTVADMSQKVVNANKTSFTSVGQPLENTNMAGLVAAH